MNSPLAGTSSEQGVRQIGPVEAFASAPGGSDLASSIPLVGAVEKAPLKSRLGIMLPQPAAARQLPTTPTTRAARLMVPSPDPVGPDAHRGGCGLSPARTIKGGRCRRNRKLSTS